MRRRRARRGTAWAGEGPRRSWAFAGGEELGFGSGRGGGEGAAAAAASLRAAAEACEVLRGLATTSTIADAQR